MKCITKDECQAWCAEHALVVGNDSSLSYKQNNTFSIRFAIPQQSRTLACLSKQLHFAFAPWKSAMIWITAWGIWSTEEDWCIFKKFRKGYDENRDLSAAPGHLFSPDEKEDVTALLRLIFVFGWDANIVTLDHDLVMFLSHDEYADVTVKSERQLADFKNSLGKIKIDFSTKQSTFNQ